MNQEKKDTPVIDWRAVIVIGAGLVVVLVIVIAAFASLPGQVPAGQVNTKGQNIVSIGGSAFTAVVSVISAYFGIKAANLAREDSEKRGAEHSLQIAHLAGAAQPDEAKAAIERFEGGSATGSQ